MDIGKTIVVTGGAGFIGSHLCDFLLACGNKVICIDNLSTGRKENIRHLEKNLAFSFVEHDIVASFFTETHIDQIYNLACPASPVQYQSNAIHTIKTNTIGVINMLGLARAHKARILQASTSEVYGDPLEHPQKETYWGNVNPIGPRACYDEGKRVAETLCFDYHRGHGVDIRVARIFNTYGPRMAHDDGRVVSSFIWSALHGEPLTVYGAGEQTRSFCYVDDMVEGLYALMNTEGLTGPINLGNPEEQTVRELAEKILALTGSRAGTVAKPLPVDDPARRKPDISRARESLGWEPRIGLEEGLAKTIMYFKGQ
ncbi:MAG: SDR family oxidoreductase [Candidatus Sungbacteria bacterium]|nr:SDR family oxidoreductase [Candidatus Sungbacteria bacterium]